MRVVKQPNNSIDMRLTMQSTADSIEKELGMLNSPGTVKKALRQRILDGYDPSWTLESAEDHWVDWLVLPKREFDTIRSAAIEERKSQRRRRR
jgi:hypothetical protein